MTDTDTTGKYRWGCGRCGREFTNNDRRETTCPSCGGYLFNPDGKTPITDGGTSGRERADCPVCGVPFDEKQQYGSGGTTQTTGFARVCHFIDDLDARTLTVYCHRRIPLEITTTKAKTSDTENTDTDQ